VLKEKRKNQRKKTSKKQGSRGEKKKSYEGEKKKIKVVLDIRHWERGGGSR